MIDNPPVNAISRQVIDDLAEGFAQFESDEDATILLLTCAGRTFVAGADIKNFDDPDFSSQSFTDLLNRIEASERPVVAVLFGTVLGGGLELAMACHGRIGTERTAFGLPEIKLGLLPGAHGTQRLPRLVGLPEAAKMISTGSMIDARKALDIGLIDRIAEPDDPAAVEAVASAFDASAPRLSQRSVVAVPDVSEELRAVAAKRSHEPAYLAIAETLDASVGLDFARAAALEAEWFARLVLSAPSRAQRHLFFAERLAPVLAGSRASETEREIATIGILGAGTMGTGIALSVALAGYDVVIGDTNQDKIDRAFRVLTDFTKSLVSRGRLAQDAVAGTLARIKGTVGTMGLASCDLVIEAVFEAMDVKLAVARELGRICKPGAIIATNTSTLDVDAIAQATGRPADVVGMHFFSPAHVMRLLEVIRGRATDPDVLRSVLKLSRRIGKTAVISGVCYGFIGNRMAEVYVRESERMQMEGAAPDSIDSVIEDPSYLGMAMGPNRMMDMAGVDVGARTVIEWIASGSGPHDPGYRAVCRKMYELGNYGQKTGRGYYVYEGRKALPNPEHAVLTAALAKEYGISRRAEISKEEIFERLFYPMVNEAAFILAEGIAQRGSDIDVVWTSGYGFPRWRGGPLFMADEIGLKHIIERIEYHAKRNGGSGEWAVAPLLRRLSESGGKLSDWAFEGSGQ
ncbi:3-hydroxyacyl-CoA dehydrogenase NAD-binding domain-containing protein [Azospirillum endophyticum]